MSLIHYRPLSDFESVPGLRVFQDTVNRLFAEPNGRPWVPAVDIRETGNELIVKADLPGMDLHDIDIHMENGTLALRGERKLEKGSDTGGWHRMERSYGTFERVFSLPDTVDADAVKADYKDGTLTITLPKKEIAKPRQIKVQAATN